MTAIIHPATVGECADILSGLSENDRKIMERAIEQSTHVWSGAVGYDVVALWGVVKPMILTDDVYLWLYPTAKFVDYRFLIARYSRHVIHEILNVYPRIVGHCEVSASNSRRWLIWLGAEFGYPTGAVIPFEIKAKK